MPPTELKSLPGAEIVLPGIADLEAGRESINAIAVKCAATRLRNGAHWRYDAILRRVASFAGAAERARPSASSPTPMPR